MQDAGISDNLPFERNRSWGIPRTSSVPTDQDQVTGQSALVYMISPGYLAAMGVPIQGRDFTWEDGPLTRDDKGKLLKGDPSSSSTRAPPAISTPTATPSVTSSMPAVSIHARIVGVIPDVHLTSVEGQPDWQVYYPITQAGP